MHVPRCRRHQRCSLTEASAAKRRPFAPAFERAKMNDGAKFVTGEYKLTGPERKEGKLTYGSREKTDKRYAGEGQAGPACQPGSVPGGNRPAGQAGGPGRNQ
jgi:hypothetical protein